MPYRTGAAQPSASVGGEEAVKADPVRGAHTLFDILDVTEYNTNVEKDPCCFLPRLFLPLITFKVWSGQ